jgi:hypothetical protein
MRVAVVSALAALASARDVPIKYATVTAKEESMMNGAQYKSTTYAGSYRQCLHESADHFTAIINGDSYMSAASGAALDITPTMYCSPIAEAIANYTGAIVRNEASVRGINDTAFVRSDDGFPEWLIFSEGMHDIMGPVTGKGRMNISDVCGDSAPFTGRVPDYASRGIDNGTKVIIVGYTRGKSTSKIIRKDQNALMERYKAFAAATPGVFFVDNRWQNYYNSSLVELFNCDQDCAHPSEKGGHLIGKSIANVMRDNPQSLKEIQEAAAQEETARRLERSMKMKHARLAKRFKALSAATI